MPTFFIVNVISFRGKKQFKLPNITIPGTHIAEYRKGRDFFYG